MRILQPPDWQRPRGYSNGVVASGHLVFIAGQIGWDANQQFTSDDFVEQTRQVLQNIVDILAEAGGEAHHITRMVWYVTDKAEYLADPKRLGEVYQAIMGKHYPAMTAVEVSALIEDRAKVEIEAIAVIPERDLKG